MKISLKVNLEENLMLSDNDTMKLYLQNLGQYPLDTPQEEIVLAKKIKSFKLIRDYYPRILISLDKPEGLEESGIKSINALDFLRNGQL